MNPFSEEVNKELLFNIGTGKSSKQETAEFLLNVNKIGQKTREDFVIQCIKDPKGFEERIPRHKILNFANEGASFSLRGANNKLIAVEMVEDLFGSILFLALQRKIDMAEVLSFPLTPTPLSLSHADGTMLKTQKSILMEELESRIFSEKPNHVYVTSIDAMFFLHLWKDVPATFGTIARFLLIKAFAQKGKNKHLVFEKAVSPSIKDCERDSRSGYEERCSQYQITGPNQRRPSNWLNALRFDQFKVTLNSFLVSAWEDNSLTEIFQGKCLYVNNGDICYCFREENGQVTRTLIPELTSSHEEADSKMIFHLTNLDENSKVIIRTSDTDVLVIALCCLEHIPVSVNVWLEVGLYAKNSLRYIDVRKLFNKLEKDLCRALPAFHVFTDSDYTAAFSRKGKIRPLKTLEKDKTVQTVFGDMEFPDDIQEGEFKVIEKFTYALYGKPNLIL